MSNIKFYIDTPLIFKAYFVLLVSIITFIIFVTHKLYIDQDFENVVAWFTAFITFIGAILTGIFTIQNSIKQYTISYWVDVRTSDSYTEAVLKVNAYGECNPMLTEEHIGDSKFISEVKPYLLQILNQLEFCAVCLRSGDFDEFILSNTMKGIVIKNFEFAQTYIYLIRKIEKRETLFEHLEALYLRWK